MPRVLVREVISISWRCSLNNGILTITHTNKLALYIMKGIIATIQKMIQVLVLLQDTQLGFVEPVALGLTFGFHSLGVRGKAPFLPTFFLSCFVALLSLSLYLSLSCILYIIILVQIFLYTFRSLLHFSYSQSIIFYFLSILLDSYLIHLLDSYSTTLLNSSFLILSYMATLLDSS